MFVSLEANPGINKEITPLENADGYSNGNNVRFWQGKPRLIGGAVDTSSGNSFGGVCRGLHTWQERIGNIDVAVGTTTEFNVWQGGIFNDITPYRKTTTPTDPFTITSASNIILVTDPSHGALTGDNIFITGATSVGNLTIGGRHQVTVNDSNSYFITSVTFALSSAEGGGTPTIGYYLAAGAVDGTTDLGWGTGPYSFGTYGTPRNITGLVLDPRTWSIDNYGQDLVFCPRSNNVFYWVAANGIGSRATDLHAYIASILPIGTMLDANIPTVAECLLVAMPNQQLCVYGTHDSTGTQDKMFMRFSGEGDITSWTASFNNTAGSFRLQGGQRVMNALHCVSEILILTDSDAIAQRFVGGSDVFGFFNIATNCGLIAPLAVVDFNGIAFWMGVDNFYSYTGDVKPIPCTIRTDILKRMNFTQRGKFHAGINRQFGEVWFFYVSTDDTEIDSFAAFKVDSLYTQTPIWWQGSVSRTAWNSGQDFSHPIATNANGGMFYQESGRLDENGDPIVGFLETGYKTFGEGDHFMFADTYIPDVLTQDETDSLDVTFKFKRYQASTETQVRGPFAVNDGTEKIKLRGRGRRLQMRYDMKGNVQLGGGTLNIQPDGKK